MVCVGTNCAVSYQNYWIFCSLDYNSSFCSGVSNEEFLSEYKGYHIPLVSIGRNFDNYLCDASISGDNIQGSLMEVRYLIRGGNKRIVYLEGNAGVSGAAQRFEGYRKGLSEANLDYLPELVHFGDFSIEYGISITRKLLEDKVDFTAIMTGSDLIAIGVIKELHKAGLRVPEDIDVMGFDDIELSQIFEPQLSTMAKPHYDMATTATRMLISLIDGTMGEMRHLTVEPRIILRSTTKKY